MQIVAWFERNARDLPWRRTTDPYGIWVSEVMLQQTQVKTVIPYWEGWMRLFPTIRSLVEAAEERVLKAWEGLGYYSRARNLQAAARIICERHDGVFPVLFEDVIDLPGIGLYTAGAVLSIAFGQRRPILDGNVARVLSRVFAIKGRVKHRDTQKRLWALSRGLVQASSNSSFLNQGLMELGAMVCLPRTALCAWCPLKGMCLAFRQGRVAEFPQAEDRVKMRKRLFHAFVLQRNGEVLVRRRARSSVNGGLWEFPNVEIAGEKAEGIQAMGESYGVQLTPLLTVKHTITRNQITLRAFSARVGRGARALAQQFEAEWRPIDCLEHLPFCSAHAKLRAAVQGARGMENSVWTA